MPNGRLAAGFEKISERRPIFREKRGLRPSLSLISPLRRPLRPINDDLSPFSHLSSSSKETPPGRELDPSFLSSLEPPSLAAHPPSILVSTACLSSVPGALHPPAESLVTPSRHRLDQRGCSGLCCSTPSIATPPCRSTDWSFGLTTTRSFLQAHSFAVEGLCARASPPIVSLRLLASVHAPARARQLISRPRHPPRARMSDSSALSSPGSSHSLPLDDSGSLSSAPSSDGGDPTAAGRSDVTNLSPSVVEACAAVALSGPAALSSSSQADRSVHGRCEGVRSLPAHVSDLS